jgi:hypothetical protein
MSNRISRVFSILVLTLTLTFTAAPFASAMEQIVPNRSTGGAFGGGDSVVLACTPTFLAAETDTAASVAAVPLGITTSMLLVEQDSGDVFLAAGQHGSSHATPVLQVAAAGCVTPV